MGNIKASVWALFWLVTGFVIPALLATEGTVAGVISSLAMLAFYGLKDRRRKFKWNGEPNASCNRLP